MKRSGWGFVHPVRHGAKWGIKRHATKTDVRIIDFVDTGHPALMRMWEKRQRGYKAMGYRLNVAPG